MIDIVKCITNTYLVTNEYAHLKTIEKSLYENKFMVVIDDEGNYKGIISCIDLIKKKHYVVTDCISKRPTISVNATLEQIASVMQNTIYNELPVFENDKFLGVICKEHYIDFLKCDKLNTPQNTLNYEQLYKLKIKLFSIIAHDLRSPYNVLLGYTNYVKENFEVLQNEDLKTHLVKIYNTAQNNFNFTQQLLNWSLKQQNGITIKKTYCNLNDVLEKVISNLMPLADQKNIKIHKECKLGQKAMQYFDENIIFNIVYNVISNAIKYSKENKSIKIETYTDDEFLYIETKDNGIGMNRKQVQKLNAIENSTELNFVKELDNYLGGFGLTYSKELVQLYKGQLIFNSFLGKGTTVLFYFPLRS